MGAPPRRQRRQHIFQELHAYAAHYLHLRKTGQDAVALLMLDLSVPKDKVYDTTQHGHHNVLCIGRDPATTDRAVRNVVRSVLMCADSMCEVVSSDLLSASDMRVPTRYLLACSTSR